MSTLPERYRTLQLRGEEILPWVEPLVALRSAAWLNADGAIRGGTDALQYDAHEAQAEHWLVLDGERLVGGARLHVFREGPPESWGHLVELVARASARGLDPAEPFCYHSRVVVDPADQGQGIGGHLFRALERASAASGARFGLTTTKRPHLVALYERLGWFHVARMKPEFQKAGTQEQTYLMAARYP